MGRKLDQILVVDVESTCWDGPPPDGEESEIIEIGLCVVDVSSLSRLSNHSILVKPERSTISPFCTELTTLTSEMFVEAGSLVEACRRFEARVSRPRIGFGRAGATTTGGNSNAFANPREWAIPLA